MSERPAPIPNCPPFVTTSGSGAKLWGSLACLTILVGVRTACTPPAPDTPPTVRAFAKTSKAPVSAGQTLASAPAYDTAASPNATPATSVSASIPMHAQAQVNSAASADQKTVPPELMQAESSLFPAHQTEGESLSNTWEAFKARLLGRANATKVMSLMKKYQVAQFIYMTEDHGGFASLGALFSKKTGPMLDDTEFRDAWDGAAQPIPLQGYFFSDIEQDSNGRLLDRSRYAGLCAYPQVPARHRPALLMLLDFAANNEADMWHFYEADSRLTGGAVRQWPGETSFGRVWMARRKYSPQEGLAKARQTFSQAPEEARARPAPTVPYDPDQYMPALHKVRTALQHRRDESGKFPRETEGLQGLLKDGIGLEEKDLMDAWGTPIHYRLFERKPGNPATEEAEVSSAGPDRQFSTADDLRCDTVLPFPWNR